MADVAVTSCVLLLFAGPMLLAGFGWYLCQRPQRRRLVSAELTQLQVLAEIEWDLLSDAGEQDGPADTY